MQSPVDFIIDYEPAPGNGLFVRPVYATVEQLKQKAAREDEIRNMVADAFNKARNSFRAPQRSKELLEILDAAKKKHDTARTAARESYLGARRGIASSSTPASFSTELSVRQLRQLVSCLRDMEIQGYKSAETITFANAREHVVTLGKKQGLSVATPFGGTALITFGGRGVPVCLEDWQVLRGDMPPAAMAALRPNSNR